MGYSYAQEYYSLNMEYDAELNDTPISSLSDEARRKLSYSLNTKKCLLSDGPRKLPRDWTGLASLVNISTQVASSIKDYPDRTAKVLELWPSGKIGQLLEFMQVIDRYDIYDDLLELAEKGCLVKTYSGGNQVALLEPLDINGGSNLITRQDVEHQAPQEYHAYILFAEEDWDFVQEMIKRLTDANYKICTFHDVMPYFATQYAPITRLITERCHKIILVISPAFLDSPVNKYYVETALSIVIETNVPKVIPCMYRDYSGLELPPEIKMYHKLYYTQPDVKSVYDFWERLILCLSSVKIGNALSSSSSINIHKQITESPNDNILSVSAPVKSASMNGLHKVTITEVSDDTKSLSSVSQISSLSDVTKKSTLRKIGNFLKPKMMKSKKNKKAICMAE